jgi:hypothetical protein
MKKERLLEHIFTTYFIYRLGLVVMGFALPLVLVGVGWSRHKLPMQDSLSAYYHAGDGAMRDVFVGVLIAVAALLILYKGLKKWEDWALNLAGVALVFVAWFPMEWPSGVSSSSWSIHGSAAIIFFLLIAVVCWFRGMDDLCRADIGYEKVWRATYKVLAILMAVIPLSAYALSLIQGSSRGILYIEACGVWVFAGYWLAKALEIKKGLNCRKRLLDDDERRDDALQSWA